MHRPTTIYLGKNFSNFYFLFSLGVVRHRQLLKNSPDGLKTEFDTSKDRKFSDAKLQRSKGVQRSSLFECIELIKLGICREYIYNIQSKLRFGKL